MNIAALIALVQRFDQLVHGIAADSYSDMHLEGDPHGIGAAYDCAVLFFPLVGDYNKEDERGRKSRNGKEK